MLADIQLTVYREEVTRQLHVMAQGRKSSPVIDRCSDYAMWFISAPNAWYRVWVTSNFVHCYVGS